MSALVRRGRAEAAAERAPLSRSLLFGFLVLILVMGYLVETSRQFPTLFIGTVSVFGLFGLFVVGIQRPEVPLYLLVAYLPFSKLLAGDFGGAVMALNLTNLLFVVIIMCFVANAATEGHPRFEPNRLHLPVILFALWGFFSLVYSCMTQGSWYRLQAIAAYKRWMDPLLIYFLFFHIVRDRRRWKAVTIILMVGVTIAALMAIRDYMTQTGGSLEHSRVGGISDQPNVLGAFFVYYMFLFAGFWFERLRRPKAWSFLIPFALCFRGIMVTFSRGAYLAFAQGLLGLTFFKNKLLFMLAVAALIVAVLNPAVLPKGIQYRLQTTFRDQTQITDVYETEHPEHHLDTSSGTRLILWRGAIQMIGDYPWMGVGLGRFPSRIGEYTPAHLSMDAHNTYLVTAAELGIPALVLFLLVLLAVFRVTSFVHKRQSDPFIRATALGFLGGLSGLLMANMFGSRMNTTEVSGYFWILAALMARAAVWTREELAAEQAPSRRRRLGRRLARGMV